MARLSESNFRAYTQPGLTERERLILIGIIRGDSTERIAERLGESEAHLRMEEASLNERFGVGGRDDAAIAAIRSGALSRGELAHALRGRVASSAGQLYQLIVSEPELEILRAAARGKRDSDLIKRLGISPKTFTMETRLLQEKLGARDRTHAVTIARVRAAPPPTTRERRTQSAHPD